MSLIDIKGHESVYEKRMADVAKEKASLMAYAPKHAIILDYGCGAGDVIQAASDMRPDLTFVGFDYSRTAIEHAVSKNIAEAYFTSDEGYALRAMRLGQPKVLYMSSLIHELVSMKGKGGLIDLYDKASGFDMVMIRDMGDSYPEGMLEDEAPDNLFGTGALRDFQERWGPCTNARNVAHLMLKARYLDNWEAEMLENYFAMSADENLILAKSYFPDVRLFEKETPPFLADAFMREYGRLPKTTTHFRLVASR